MASNIEVIKNATPYFVFLNELDAAVNKQGKEALIKDIKAIQDIPEDALKALLEVAEGYAGDCVRDFSADDTINNFITFDEVAQADMLEWLKRGGTPCQVLAEGLHAMVIICDLLPCSLDEYDLIHVDTLSGKERRKSGRWFDLELKIGTKAFKGIYTTNCDDSIFSRL